MADNFKLIQGNSISSFALAITATNTALAALITANAPQPITPYSMSLANSGGANWNVLVAIKYQD